MRNDSTQSNRGGNTVKSVRRHRPDNQGGLTLNTRTPSEKNWTFTKHVEKRLQQRGISKTRLEWVLAFGKRIYHKGAYVYFMTKRRHKNAETVLGCRGYPQLSDKLDIYVVVSLDGDVITVAHRLVHLKS